MSEKAHVVSCGAALALSVVLPVAVPSTVIAGFAAAGGGIAGNLLSSWVERRLDRRRDDTRTEEIDESLLDILCGAIRAELVRYANGAQHKRERDLARRLAKEVNRSGRRVFSSPELATVPGLDLGNVLAAATEEGESPEIEPLAYWEDFLRALNAAGDHGLTTGVRGKLAAHLRGRVWASYRRELAADFSHDGEAYANVQLAFMGEVLAGLRESKEMQAEIRAQLGAFGQRLEDVLGKLDTKRDAILQRQANPEAVARWDAFYREQSSSFAQVLSKLDDIESKIDALAEGVGQLTQSAAEAPDEDSRHRVVDEYLDMVRKRFGALELPNLTGRRVAPVLPLARVFVEVPLRLVRSANSAENELAAVVDAEERFLAEPSANGAEEFFFKERLSFTSSYLYEQAAIAGAGEEEGARVRLIERVDAVLGSVLVGAPGSGKTTMLHALAAACAARCLEEEDADVADGADGAEGGEPAPEEPQPTTAGSGASDDAEGLACMRPRQALIPIVLTLRQLPRGDLDRPLDDLLRAQLKLWSWRGSEETALRDALLDALADGSGILLVDGLDEVPTLEVRLAVAETIAEFVRSHPATPVVVTSRPAGFRSVERALGGLDHLTVAPLPAETRGRYVERFAGLFTKPLPAERVRAVVRDVGSSRLIARLCENVLSLSLLTQINLTDKALLQTRPDVFLRVVQLLIQNQRGPVAEHLEHNQLWAALEVLAFAMREAGDQSWSESRALACIRDGHELMGVDAPEDPAVWLRRAVENVGVLQVAGSRYDESTGREEREYQFFHGSFQEYFACQAILHERSTLPGGDVLSRFGNLVRKFEIEAQPIDGIADGSRSEPVAGGQWRETARHLIGELDGQEPPRSGQVIAMLLSMATSTLEEARAVATLSMESLADAPNCDPKVAERAIVALIDCLREEDGFNTTLNTTADAALHAIGSGPWRPLLEKVLEREFRARTGRHRSHIGRAWSVLFAGSDKDNAGMMVERLLRLKKAKDEARVGAWIAFMEASYQRHRRLKRAEEVVLDAELAEIVEGLARPCLVEGGAERHAALWALYWLHSAGVQRRARMLAPDTLALLAECLADDDSGTQELAALLLGTQAAAPMLAREDPIYEWARRADGAAAEEIEVDRPPQLKPVGLDALERVARSGSTARSRSMAAVALGRLGYLSGEFAPLLFDEFATAELRNEDWRDELLIYAILSDPSQVEEQLIAWSAEPDTYRTARAYLALMHSTSVDVLARCLRRGTVPMGDPRPFAYRLAGLGTEEARAALDACRDHELEEVRAAVVAAEKARAKWEGGVEASAPSVEDGEGTYQLTAGAAYLWVLRGTDKESGKKAYWVVLVSRDRMDAFREALKTGTLDVTEYGQIVASGMGEEVPEELRDELRKKYGTEFEE